MIPDAKLRLLDAVVLGDAATVRKLIASGVNPNFVFRNWSPLHWACQEGRLQVARVLLESGALVDKRDDHGFTPLHIAVGENRTRIAKLLLAWGANVRAKAKANGNGQPIHTAAAWGHPAMLKLLLKGGADIHARDAEGNTAQAFARRYGHREILK